MTDAAPLQAIGFIVSKAPGGGYQLAKLTSIKDGAVQSEVIAYRTLLIEVQDIEHRLKTQLFGEAAWLPPSFHQQQVQPIPPPVERDEFEPPRFMDAPEQIDHVKGLMDRLNLHGHHIKSLMAPLFMVCLWAGMHV